MKRLITSTLAVTAVLATIWPANAQFRRGNRDTTISLQAISTYATGVFDEGACEIVAHDPRSQRLFIVNADAAGIDVMDISNPDSPNYLFTIDISPFGKLANSVAVHKGLVAAAVEANTKTDPGKVAFFDTDGNVINSLTVGSLPDMLTFSPNGKYLLVANEGEPNDNYSVDPLGTISIIRMRQPANLTQQDVVTLDFSEFNNTILDPSIRIFGPGATVAQDLEPEYITISDDSRTAWVTLQENNAIAEIDIRRGRTRRLVGLGFKDHRFTPNALDASDRDDAINIATWPVFGMYQPDGIASFTLRNRTYLIMANEGDARDYDGLEEEDRVKDLDLDPSAFPNAAGLQEDGAIGRLTVTNTLGDTDNDGDFDELYAFGGRSFSIRDSRGQLIYDSGDQLEQITADALPNDFNSTNDENDTFDNRSDNKGPEPEGVTVGKIGGKTYAFVGLERISGIAVFDVSNPNSPEFVQYVTTRDFSGDPEADTAGDLGPEGLIFISAKDSPNGKPLLVVANEVSGSTTIYEISILNKNIQK